MTLDEANHRLAYLGLELRYQEDIAFYYIFQDIQVSLGYDVAYPAYKSVDRAVAMAEAGVRPHIGWRSYRRW